jgi:4-hydroxybenzoate polyprenyltransferase
LIRQNGIRPDVMAFLALIRWRNLLIIFLTQLLAWWCVILPMKAHTYIPLLLDATRFGLLSLSTMLIAAAGYVINDYFDIKIDSINRPHKLILEKKIPIKYAIILHTVLNVIGILLAALVARMAGHYSWLLLQLGCTALLWLYSTRFKRQFVIGNAAVSLLTAFTIVTLMLYEPGLRHYANKPYLLTIATGYMVNPIWVLGVYAYFAFMLTWMREIVKDMEDFKGDAQEGCLTMPIKWGLLLSVRFIQVLGLLVIVPLIIGSLKLMRTEWMPLGVYTLALIVAPLLVWIVYLPRKATTQHYLNMSRWLKLIMVSGILSFIVYYFEAHA